MCGRSRVFVGEGGGGAGSEYQFWMHLSTLPQMFGKQNFKAYTTAQMEIFF